MRVVLVVCSSTKKSIVGFLEQVVCEIRSSGEASEICPERARRPIVERAKDSLVHLEHGVAGINLGAKLFDV